MRDRTADLLRAKQALSQLSYSPIDHNLVSVTVIAPTALEADAWDTGLMVLGTAKAQEVVRKEGLAVYMIMREGDKFTTWVSPQFSAFLVSEKN